MHSGAALHGKEAYMSKNEKNFLQIVDLKKGYGKGETRQEVLRVSR